jgi:hypothetical protein
MAARTVKIRHDEETRAKIKTSQLLNRLSNHVFKETKVSSTQLKAIEILLRKTLPDLTAITLSGDPENPLEMNVNLSTQDRARALAAFVAKTKTTGR